MSASSDQPSSHHRDGVEGLFSGSQARPFFPKLRSDPLSWYPLPRSLAEYREKEGKEKREARLRALWKRLPTHRTTFEHDEWINQTGMDAERAKRLRDMYEDELMRRCTAGGTTSIEWKDFLEYADAKEAGK